MLFNKLFINSFCVGCNKCLLVCPTNAIIGSIGYFCFIFERKCFFCKKCVNVCPANSICVNYYNFCITLNYSVLRYMLLLKLKNSNKIIFCKKHGYFYNSFNELVKVKLNSFF